MILQQLKTIRIRSRCLVLLSLFIISSVLIFHFEVQAYSIYQVAIIEEPMQGFHNFRAIDKKDFSYPKDSKIVFYVALYNDSKDHEIMITWFKPDGSFYSNEKNLQKQSGSYPRFFYSQFILETEKIKDFPGKWKAELRIDGSLAKTEQFNLKSPLPSQESVPKAKTPEQVDLRKEQAKALYNDGNKQFESKDYKEAIASYRKAIDLESGFAPLYYNLGMAQAALGQKKEAAANFTRFLELRPGASNAAEVRALIQSLSQ